MEVRMRSLFRAQRIAWCLFVLGLILATARSLSAVEEVTLSWHRNGEPDLAGYKVYYGMQSGQYDFTADAALDTSFTFTDLDSARYYFVVTALDTAGNESAFSEEIAWDPKPEEPVGIGDDVAGGPGAPRSFELSQNFPNPFNPSTSIRYTIARDGRDGRVPTTLRVYDMRGRQVRTLVEEEKSPGEYIVHWDGQDDRGVRLASGTYLYHIRAGDWSATRKLVIDK
jgi:hypothetical protein